MKIKQGDNVIVISGKDKGKTGKVTAVLSAQSRLIVEGVHTKKKHQKPRRANQKGQILDIPSPIHVSNVMLVDPKNHKPTRVGFIVKDGKKLRVAKKSGAVL